MTRKLNQFAKLARPGLHGATRRGRLISRLDQIREHPLIWVCGPPGAGKTALVASWLDSRRLKGIWYRLDSADTDIPTFFYYLGVAVRQLSPRKRPMPLLTPEYLPDLEGFVRRYFRELFARMPESSVLVLDNCHEIPADAAFWGVLHDAASEVAPGRNIVAIGRSEPAEKLSPLIANQALSRIDWEDLKLTYEETVAIAGARNVLDARVASELHRRSDGWAAGLILLLDGVRHGTPDLALAPMQARQTVFDYFADQVFDRAAENLRMTLLAIALLHTCTARECETLTGNSESGKLLESLYRRQMFVDCHNGPEPHYRLHDLFRDFLLARVETLLTPGEAHSLRQKAAQILEAAGASDHAFSLYAKVQDWNAASRIVLAGAQRLFSDGRSRTLRDWIDTLPIQLVHDQPWLSYWLGLALFQADLAASRETLSRAYDAFESRSDVIGQMSTAAAILTGFYFEYVDWKPADRWIERLGGLLKKQPVLPTPELSLFVYSAMLYGIAIRQTNHPMRTICIERTLSLLRDDADVNARLQGGMAITGPVACMLGAFDLFREVRQMLSPLLRDPHITELNRACWHMACGAKLSFDCEFDEAYGELETAARLAKEYNLRQIEFLSHHFEGLHAACYFDLERARIAFTRARELADFANPLQRAYLIWGQAAEALATGNAPVALERSREGKIVGDSIGSAAHSIIGSVFLGGALVLSGHHDEADAVATEALNYSKQQKIPTWEAGLLLILAWSRQERGDDARAQDLFLQALARGRDGSSAYFRWVFLGAHKMLSLASRTGAEDHYVQALIRRFRYHAEDQRLENWPWPLKIRTLGGFKVEIGGNPLVFGRKVPRRPLGLLQCLIALGGYDVPEHRLADVLWPDADGDEAHKRLTLTLHRLRQLLGEHNCIRLQGGKISLDARRVWVDAFAFERLLSERSTSAATALALYCGDFLAAEPEEPWMLPMRDRLRRIATGLSEKLSTEPRIRNQKETPRPLV